MLLMSHYFIILPLSLALLAMYASAATAYIPSKHQAQRQNQTIQWVDCHEKVPQPVSTSLNVTGTTFNGTLPSTLFCGQMDVPMDYTKPFDPSTNNITIGFAMHRPARSSGLVI
jgi:hypothetical protein